MSGIAGVFNLTGEPVDPALLGRMTASIAHRGPDGIQYAIDGFIGIAHCKLATTPESLAETQPLWDESHTCCLALDGRVDNREELARDLKSAGAVLRDGSDAELVLKAFLAWRADSPRRIVGDFAYVVWDSGSRRLFCARDHVGIRPFYYFTDGSVFLWASELRPILQHPSVSCAPNEGMIAEYLADRICTRGETLYRDIRKLPGACCATVDPRGTSVRAYWTLNPEESIRYKRDADYAAHFSAVFEQAVRCRLRTHTAHIGAELSGGLDSSSVVMTADRLLSAGGRPKLRTFSLVFPGLPCDETPYIQAVVDRTGVHSTLVPPSHASASDVVRQVEDYADLPDYPTVSMADGLRRAANAQGTRVLLTGYGGDQWLTGDLFYAADLIRSGRWFECLCRLKDESRRGRIDSIPMAAFNYGIRPLAPQILRRAVRRFRGGSAGPRFPWLRDEFIRESNLLDRIRYRPPACRRFAMREFVETLGSGFLEHGFDMMDRSVARFALESRHPFFDIRLIEFLAAVPSDQRRRGAIKFVLRNATRGTLPEMVRVRQDKADFGRQFIAALECLGGSGLFADGRLSTSHRLNLAETRRMCAEMAAAAGAYNNRALPHTWQLWLAAAVDLWLQKLPAPSGRDTLTGCLAPMET